MTHTEISQELPLNCVAFYGRTLAEYMRFFALTPEALQGSSILDVAAGPCSFTAEATRRGSDATAVEPL